MPAQDDGLGMDRSTAKPTVGTLGDSPVIKSLPALADLIRRGWSRLGVTAHGLAAAVSALYGAAYRFGVLDALAQTLVSGAER